jgi:hypothetical protein
MSRSPQAIALPAFEKRHNRHSMAMPESKVCLEPRHHCTGFHARLELAALRETVIRREPAEVSGAFARFCLYVVKVCLK